MSIVNKEKIMLMLQTDFLMCGTVTHPCLCKYWQSDTAPCMWPFSIVAIIVLPIYGTRECHVRIRNKVKDHVVVITRLLVVFRLYFPRYNQGGGVRGGGSGAGANLAYTRSKSVPVTQISDFSDFYCCALFSYKINNINNIYKDYIK